MDLLCDNLEAEDLDLSGKGPQKRYRFNDIVTVGYDIAAVVGTNPAQSITNPIAGGSDSLIVGIALVLTAPSAANSASSSFTFRVNNKNAFESINAALLDNTLNHAKSIFVPVMYKASSNAQIQAILTSSVAANWHLDVFFRPLYGDEKK